MRLFIEQRHIDAAVHSLGTGADCPIALAAREQFGIPGVPMDHTVRAAQMRKGITKTGWLKVHFEGRLNTRPTIYDVGRKGRAFMDLFDYERATYRSKAMTIQPTVIELEEVDKPYKMGQRG